MTFDDHRDRLERILYEWQERLKISHIDIEILWDEEPENEHALADIAPSDLYDRAEMRMAPGWTVHDVYELNCLVVHELMHVMFRDYDQSVRSASVSGALSMDVRSMWHDRCHDTNEALVDRLANRFVDLGGAVE